MAEDTILGRQINNVIHGSVILPKARLISPEISDEEEEPFKTQRDKQTRRFEDGFDSSVFRETGHRRATQSDFKVDPGVLRDLGHRRATK